MSTQQVNLLLSRLDKVKKTGQDKWSARCPSHHDAHPSLAVSIGKSGAPIIKCWGGCGAAEVLAALGLDFADLYPRRPARQGERGPARYFFPQDVFEEIKLGLLTALLQIKEKNEAGLAGTIVRLESISFAYTGGATK